MFAIHFHCQSEHYIVIISAIPALSYQLKFTYLIDSFTFVTLKDNIQWIELVFSDLFIYLPYLVVYYLIRCYIINAR